MTIDAMVREYATGSVHPQDVVGALHGTDFQQPVRRRGTAVRELTSRYWPVPAAVVALLLVAVSGPMLREWSQSRGWSEYSAGGASPRKILLSDQSIMTLQQCSHLLVRYSGALREFRME